MKIKHYSIFNKPMQSLNWEDLRDNENEKPYFLPFTKEEYLKKVDVEKPISKTKLILHEIESSGLRKIFSIGSGIAAQEFQIKKFSDFQVFVSDSDRSILRLHNFNIFDDAIILDAINDPLPLDETYFVLLPRIDTEFNDIELSRLFAKFHYVGVTHILFIPAELLNIRIIIIEIKIMIISIIKRKHRVFCGYARSMKSFMKIWGPFYQISKKYHNGGQPFFLLKSK